MTQKIAFLLLLLIAPVATHAESGYKSWLRYAPLDEAIAAKYRMSLPAVITAAGKEPTIQSAQQELTDGIRSMLGRTLRHELGVTSENAIVIGTLDEIRQRAPQFSLAANLSADAYW